MLELYIVIHTKGEKILIESPWFGLHQDLEPLEDPNHSLALVPSRGAGAKSDFCGCYGFLINLFLFVKPGTQS